MIAAIQNHTLFLDPVRKWAQNHTTITKIIQIATLVFTTRFLFAVPAAGLATLAGALVLQLLCLQAVQGVKPIDEGMRERIMGAFCGQFVGDALGVTTEFMNRASAQRVIQLGPLEYSTRHDTEAFREIERGNELNHHQWRLNFPFRGWTAHSDQAICILKALKATDKPPDKAFAKELMQWVKHGLAGRNFAAQSEGREDRGSGPKALGVGPLVGAVMGILPHNVAKQRAFLRNPKERAIEVRNDQAAAGSGALMRTSPIALFFKNDFEQMIKHTIEMCQVTHADPRCVASCVAANTAIYHMIHGKRDLNQIRALALDEARKIDDDPALTQAIYTNTFEELNHQAIGHTYKCLGAAFAALAKAARGETFRTIITDLVGEGVEAKSAIAGAMIGAYLGMDAIPDSWKQVRDRGLLQDLARWVC